MQPVQGAPCLRLMSHTHPEFGQLMADYAERAQAHMGLLRGTEGEAVADPRRGLRQRVWIAGQAQPDLASEPEPGALATPPDLPAAIDAPTTARWIESALRGQAPVPISMGLQVKRLMQAFDRVAATREMPADNGRSQVADSS
jgi:anthranilate phosphoribosyltransferase